MEPPDGCFVKFRNDSDARQPYNASWIGRILVDDRSGDLIRFEAEASGFPRGADIIRRNEVQTWDYARIGNASYLLPVSAEFVWRYASVPYRRAVIQYKNHRHFEASTKLSFEGK